MTLVHDPRIMQVEMGLWIFQNAAGREIGSLTAAERFDVAIGEVLNEARRRNAAKPHVAAWLKRAASRVPDDYIDTVVAPNGLRYPVDEF